MDPNGESPCGLACQAIVRVHVSAAVKDPVSYGKGMVRGAPRAGTKTFDLLAQSSPVMGVMASTLSDMGLTGTGAYNNAIGPAENGTMALGEQSGEFAAGMVGGGSAKGGAIASGLKGIGKNPVKGTADRVADFLGEGFKVKRSDSKGFVAMSADGNRRFRSDIGGHGDKPHAHLEIKNEHGNFKGATSQHRLYFKED